MVIKNILVLFVGIFISLFDPNNISAQKNDILLQISQANEFYHEKDYQSAATIFENLLMQGQKNGYLYYNLGNTYMRLEKKGHAILNYMHAKKLLPRNASLDANLRHAISQTVEQLPPPQMPIINAFLFWVESISLTEHLDLFIIVNFLFWSIYIGLTYKQTPIWNNLKNITLGMLLVIFFSTGVKYYSLTNQKYGVILINKANIKSDRGVNDITLFQLHEGAIVSINQEEKNWVQVSLDKDKSGWVQRRAIGF